MPPTASNGNTGELTIRERQGYSIGSAACSRRRWPRAACSRLRLCRARGVSAPPRREAVLRHRGAARDRARPRAIATVRARSFLDCYSAKALARARAVLSKGLLRRSSAGSSRSCSRARARRVSGQLPSAIASIVGARATLPAERTRVDAYARRQRSSRTWARGARVLARGRAPRAWLPEDAARRAHVLHYALNTTRTTVAERDARRATAPSYEFRSSVDVALDRPVL